MIKFTTYEISVPHIQSVNLGYKWPAQTRNGYVLQFAFYFSEIYTVFNLLDTWQASISFGLIFPGSRDYSFYVFARSYLFDNRIQTKSIY